MGDLGVRWELDMPPKEILASELGFSALLPSFCSFRSGRKHRGFLLQKGIKEEIKEETRRILQRSRGRRIILSLKGSIGVCSSSGGNRGKRDVWTWCV